MMRFCNNNEISYTDIKRGELSPVVALGDDSFNQFSPGFFKYVSVHLSAFVYTFTEPAGDCSRGDFCLNERAELKVLLLRLSLG